MSQTRFQDFWVAGARFYFKRENDADGTEHELVDLGVIDPVDPKVAPTAIELYDSDGGLKSLVESAVTFLDESYDIKCSNFNPDNIALLFYATTAESFTQAAAEVDVAHKAIVGRLVKLKDSTGAYVYGLSAVAGVYTGTLTSKTVHDIVVSSKTIKLTGDWHLAGGLAAGKAIIVHATALTNIANSRTYTVVSATYDGTTYTNVVVEETPAADETAIAGSASYENSGTIYKQAENSNDTSDDWEVYSLDRGIVRMIDGGAFAADATLQVVYSTAALTGKRLVNPQTVSNFVKGTGFLVYGRSNNTKQSVREFTCQIKPNGSTIGYDKYSQMTLSVVVLRDISSATPAGRLLQFKGDLPDDIS